MLGSIDAIKEAEVLDSLPLGVFSLSVEGVVLFANPVAETILGRSAALLQGQKVDALIDRDCEIFPLLEKVWREDAAVVARQVLISGPTISKVTLDISAALSSDREFATVSLLPNNAGSDLEEMSKSATMAEVARILGHEVKNPLAGMVGAAQLLARQARDDQQAMLTLIREEGARIGRLVDRFAAFETFFRPRFSSTNVHEVLTRVLEIAETSFASDLDLQVGFDPSLPEVSADPDHLHEACLNIVKNAAEAVRGYRSDGRIRIETRYRHGVKLRPSAYASKTGRSGALEISIIDNGPGVPKKVADKIFTPFFTTKESGAGIGLSVVAEIVTAHGGYLEMQNTSDGACFKILLQIDSPEKKTNK